MAKNGKKESGFINDPRRCGICDTTLTLYPKDFAACPHCQRVVCRQCWGGSWAGKSFASDKCSHLTEEEGKAIAPVGESNQKFQLDWPRAVFILILAALVFGIGYFFWTLFL